MVSKVEMEEIIEGTGWKIESFLDSVGPSYVAVIVKE
jgi:hypothetical protein